MNINNIFLAGSMALASMATLVSCDDQLSALPAQQKVDGNLIVDQKSAENALNGIYYMYAECGTDYYDVLSTGCAVNQEIYPANYAGVIRYYQGAYMLENHNQTPSDYYTPNLWRTLYSQLNTANGVIKQLNAAPDSWFSANRKAQIMGEARFMRALCHYNLLRWYAQYWDTSSSYGVLLRTEPVLAGSIPKSRSSVKDSYNLILEDLDYAIDNAPAENPNYYATSWTAKGLKARVLMMRGEGTDYADAEALCKDIIDNGPYELEQHTEDIFYQKGLESKEVIFGIQPKDGQTNVFEAYYYRGISNYYPTKPFYALFDDKDPRKSRLFLIKDKLNSMGQVTGVDTLICKHINPEKITSNTIEESQYQMRLTEIYLLRAEAIVRHDPSRLDEARELLRTVLTHSQAENIYKTDTANTPDALLAEIFHEMLRNLFCESGRELEIMMRMPREAVIPINEFRDTPNFMIFPVPADEFRYNPLFGEQNPGYGKV